MLNFRIVKLHLNWLGLTRKCSPYLVIIIISIAVVLPAFGDSANDSEAVASNNALNITIFPESTRAKLKDLPGSVVRLLAKARARGPGTLIWKDGGGALHNAFETGYLKEWEEITGWTVIASAPSPSPGELRVQVNSGEPQLDVIEIGNIGLATTMEEANLLATFSNGLQEYLEKTMPKGYESTPDRVQYAAIAAPIVWNTDVWPVDGKHPSVPADLFDKKKFPGTRCFYGRPEVFPGTLVYALTADGVAFGDLYPLDIPRALAKLDTIKEQSVFWTSGAQSIQFILNGNCDLGWSWNGRVASELRVNPDAPLGYSFKNALVAASYLAIPRGAPHKIAAESALAYAYTAQNQCDVLNQSAYGVPIDESCIEDALRKFAVTDSVLDESAGIIDNSEQNTRAITEQFSAWLAK